MRALALAMALLATPALACEGALPDTAMPGTVALHDGTGMTRAWFDGPTRRYPHGVLDDDIEAGELWAEVPTSTGCARLSVILPETRVFEDLAPRLADLDGDGRAEIVVVESDRNLGARLAVYGGTDRLDLLAATPFIGQPNRWLAPVGIADLDGDGAMDIAYIDRPHLARTLRIWRYSDGTLTEIAALEGLTNHRIGEDFISGGIRHCGQGPQIVTADANWTSVMITTLAAGRLTTTATAPYSAGAMRDILGCRG